MLMLLNPFRVRGIGVYISPGKRDIASLFSLPGGTNIQPLRGCSALIVSYLGKTGRRGRGSAVGVQRDREALRRPMGVERLIRRQLGDSGGVNPRSAACGPAPGPVISCRSYAIVIRLSKNSHISTKWHYTTKVWLRIYESFSIVFQECDSCRVLEEATLVSPSRRVVY